MNSTAIDKYISEVGRYFADEKSTEMSYRTAFQNYLESIFPRAEKFHIQHDPKVEKGNKPDFIVLRDGVPVLYLEVKKAGEDLDKIERSAQAARYFGYTNLVISDYCQFRFYRNGERYDNDPIQVANISSGVFIPQTNKAEYLERTLKDFISTQREPIKNGKHLARIMGGKAQRIRDNVVAFLASESPDKEELEKMMRFIQDHLIEKFDLADFADMYAQTLVYGLFAARYNDKTLGDFSRQEARTLVPKTNPFLQHFFDHIAGATFPKRLEIIVDELCVVFSHADVRSLMEDYFKKTDLFGVDHDAPDPVIHFYEDFLHEYDSAKKMEMGVFYTPLPVVRFIVRGIDELLKKEFGIVKGISDSTKTETVVDVIDKKGNAKRGKVMMHRVQLLDFATGTGTFLNETISLIVDELKGNEGRWNTYVEEDLLPRLHGFELMMASYTIAHLKLAMSLAKSGVTSFKNRIGLYLTNTLDDAHDIPRQGNLFGFVDSIAQESILASQVKKDHPIMVVMGNPPYSGISQNPHYTKNDVYKVEPGGKERLKEKKHWLDDDYVKFMRFAEAMIEKNGEGIAGLISAHGYIDNPTFRGMRWHLRNTFDTIYVLDLHGNSNKKEVSPDGSRDENVFDIKTGVAIVFCVKKAREKGTKKPLAEVFKADLYGLRSEKFAALSKNRFETIDWQLISGERDPWTVEVAGGDEYRVGFSLVELFKKTTTGMVTARDAVVVDMSREVLLKRVKTFAESEMSETELRSYLFPGKKDGKYKAGDTRGWKLVDARRQIRDIAHESVIKPITYRPFDIRYCYYHPTMVDWGRFEFIKNLPVDDQLGLIWVQRSPAQTPASYIFVTQNMCVNGSIRSDSVSIDTYGPLYVMENGVKVSNLSADIVTRIERVVGKTTPEDVLDYVYGVLHSPAYRRKFKSLLKTDYPRVSYPASSAIFEKYAKWGNKLRRLHLLTDSVVEKRTTSFPIAGSNRIEKPEWRNDRVYINKTQYWEGISNDVWGYYVGGYQPMQKYLKDRKDTILTNAEFENYEKMSVAIAESNNVFDEMSEFEKYHNK